MKRAPAGSPSSAQLFLELDEIIAKRQRKPKWAYSWWVIAVVMALGVIQIVIPDGNVKFALLIVQGILLLWYLRSAFIGMRRSSVIRMVKRSEAPSFVVRNKDQMLLMIISALVGGLVTFAATQLKDRYFPASTVAPKQ